jgi:CheY-like chemotaxis protein
MSDVKRILYVEDSPEDVELTLAALQDNGLANEVVVARDGVEAIDYLERRGGFAGRTAGDPAVVLLDIKMPRLDGLEVLRWIRSQARLRSLPVVMLTSSREERDIVESYQIGVNAYVVKPVAFGDFMEAVRTLGLFWAILNEPMPGALRDPASGTSKAA